WTSGCWSDAVRSMQELARLAETARSTVLDGVIQRRDVPDSATYFGSGRARNLRDLARELGADTVIVDGEMSPGQLQRLEQVTGVKVVDRTWLILDIFAQHARSREGKAQVDLAQLEYLLPRLRGWGESMSRLGGGIGTRGPGETKIETDRRRIRTRISRLRRQIAAMSVAREVSRRNRRGSALPSVAIVGYTNAGKSSLLNRLTSAEVLVHDELFATLDPTVRRCRTTGGREFTLTDTVGFVSHLPHQLVEAFRSTMEEVAQADLLVLVVDGSTPEANRQIEAVRDVLREVQADSVPEIVVINKGDIADPDTVHEIRSRNPEALVISAQTGAGIDSLLGDIAEHLPVPAEEVDVVVALDRGDLVARLHEEGEVKGVDYSPSGIHVIGLANKELARKLRDAQVNSENG
ncbi:MAG: GTPase HflX, partial [Candidatus Nanopelagicales bacterium]|nr:GTPase HflX [Candidatus Nanopelagicales bacterium]